MALMNFAAKYGVQGGLGAMAGSEHAGGSDASMGDRALGAIAGAGAGIGIGVAANKLMHAHSWFKASKAGKVAKATTAPIPKPAGVVNTLKPIKMSAPNVNTRIGKLKGSPGYRVRPVNKPIIPDARVAPPKTPYNKTWANTKGFAAGVGLTGYAAHNQNEKNLQKMNERMTKMASGEMMRNALEKSAGIYSGMVGGTLGAGAGYYASSDDPKSTALHRIGGTLAGGLAGGATGTAVGARRIIKNRKGIMGLNPGGPGFDEKAARRLIYGKKRDVAYAAAVPGAMVGYGIHKRNKKNKKAGMIGVTTGTVGGLAGGWYASSHDPKSSGWYRTSGALLGGLAGGAVGAGVSGRRVYKDVKGGLGEIAGAGTGIASGARRVDPQVAGQWMKKNLAGLDGKAAVDKGGAIGVRAIMGKKRDALYAGALPAGMIAYGQRERNARSKKR